MNELGDWIAQSDDNRRLLAEEYLIATVAQQIWAEMERRGISRASLADTLKRSRAFVSQVLSGSSNMTLRTVADIADAIECSVEVQLRPLGNGDWEEVPIASRPRVVQFLRPELSCNQSEWTTLVGPSAATEAA